MNWAVIIMCESLSLSLSPLSTTHTPENNGIGTHEESYNRNLRRRRRKRRRRIKEERIRMTELRWKSQWEKVGTTTKVLFHNISHTHKYRRQPSNFVFLDNLRYNNYYCYCCCCCCHSNTKSCQNWLVSYCWKINLNNKIWISFFFSHDQFKATVWRWIVQEDKLSRCGRRAGKHSGRLLGRNGCSAIVPIMADR